MTTLLLPVHARPEFALRMAEAASAWPCIDEVVVSLQHPGLDLAPFRAVGAQVVPTAVERCAGYRWFALGDDVDDVVVSIDDDTHLRLEQMTALLRFVEEAPAGPHGAMGSCYPDRPFVDDEGNARNLYYERSDRLVDALHQVYGVTAEHIHRYRERSSTLKSFDPLRASSYGEDLVLGTCGSGPAQIHDIGLIEEHPSSWDPAVALHGRPNFNRQRAAVLEEIDRNGWRWPTTAGERFDVEGSTT